MKRCIQLIGPEPFFFFPLPFGNVDPGKHEHLHVCDRFRHLFHLPGHLDLEHLQRPQSGKERSTFRKTSGPARHGRHGELLSVPCGQRGLTPAFPRLVRETRGSLRNKGPFNQFERLCSCIQKGNARGPSSENCNWVNGATKCESFVIRVSLNRGDPTWPNRGRLCSASVLLGPHVKWT